MLINTIGVRLLLWMGANVPTPVPYEVTSAVTQVQVTTADSDDGSGFQITLAMGKSLEDFPLLSDDTLAPFTRVIIGVLLGARLQVLMDGVILHHQITPGQEPGTATLTVSGTDVTALLDTEERRAPFERESDANYVHRLLNRYPRLGITVEGVQETQSPNENTQWQRETDLACIRRLAQRNGYVFYLEPDKPFINRAHFAPRLRTGALQPPLAIDMGPATNLTSLNFSQDGWSPVAPAGHYIEPQTHTVLPIPLPPLPTFPPFAAQRSSIRRTALLTDTAKQDSMMSYLSATAVMAASPDAVRGEGELDTLRYGYVLQARRLVSVCGAGLSYDGVYYVQQVTHKIERGSFTQSFSISREGTGNLLPGGMSDE